MTLKDTLQKNKRLLLDKWFKATIDTYPAQTAKVLGKDANRFDNPVGACTRESLEDVLDLLPDHPDLEALEKALDPIIRIRAVQAFSAAEAVSFVYSLKKIGRDVLEDAQMEEFHTLVDTLAQAAFNKLLKCKEEIFLLKATESKRRIHKAFERAGLVTELSEKDLLGSKKS